VHLGPCLQRVDHGAGEHGVLLAVDGLAADDRLEVALVGVDESPCLDQQVMFGGGAGLGRRVEHRVEPGLGGLEHAGRGAHDPPGLGWLGPGGLVGGRGGAPPGRGLGPPGRRVCLRAHDAGPLGGGLLLLEVFAENLAHLAGGGPVVFGGSRADLLKQAYR
jgi:hypothetical protein